MGYSASNGPDIAYILGEGVAKWTALKTHYISWEDFVLIKRGNSQPAFKIYPDVVESKNIRSCNFSD
jgi:hypothetical protein